MSLALKALVLSRQSYPGWSHITKCLLTCSRATVFLEDFIKPFHLHSTWLKCQQLRFVHSSLSVGFEDKGSVNSTFSFADYDVIGFDLDHTIAKYKLLPTFELVWSILADFLVKNRNYPPSLCQTPVVSTDFLSKGLIVDKARGNFLKLSHDHSIVRASHGTTRMTSDEIRHIYGTNRIWEPVMNLADRLCYQNQIQPFFVFKDNFVIAPALTCAQIVDALDKEQGKSSICYDFWKDVYDGFMYMFQRDAFIKQVGGYFPAIQRDISTYINPCDTNLRKWLDDLHSKKKTYLLTGSNVDYASYLAEFCLGPKWKDKFDLIITYACKPGFFIANRPFLNLDGINETSVVKEGLQPGRIYSQGNWQELHTFFAQLVGKSKPKILYIGDSVLEDVFAPSKFTSCESVAVVQEIVSEESSGLLTSEMWGSYFSDCLSDGEKSENTLWADLIMKHSQIAIPDLESVTSFPVDQRYPSFKNGPNGFFPKLPKMF
ncbi:5'-nucleotidase domain-containing protein 1-like [Limulus polyphemus]|uniref:5'-nucleotidase domain-containing protein 1-like n=1 Tax=Limulus polyphemus TaxID=6850 RepID=A0ABM1TPA8_LIMPO|nr:5'-nucleotidase domain-containing protein 1-like [Limulus polyphemus]